MFQKVLAVLFLFFATVVSAGAVASSDAYYQAGNKLYTQGNYALCMRYYQAAIQVDPQNWKAYQALGSCQYRLGQRDAALANFNQSLAINPNNPGLAAFRDKIAASASAAPPQPMRPLRRDDALPREGSITWNLTLGGDLDSYDDFTNYYGPSLNTNDLTAVGVEFGVGGDYTLSPNFQVGFNLEGIYKATAPVSITNYYYGYTEEDTWSDLCFGPAVDLKYLIPINRDYTVILSGKLGYYFLTGSVSEAAAGYYTSASEAVQLSSSSVGGLLGVEVEWMRGPGWATDFGLGYRFLSFSPITYNYNAASSSGYSGSGNGTLLNYEGQKAFIDFTGFNFTAAIRFF